MNKLINFLQEKLLPIAAKLSANKYLSSLSESFQLLIPIILVGSFACLGAFLNIDAWQSFVTSTGLQMVFMNIQSVTLSIIALYLVFTLPLQLSKKLGVDPIPTALTTLAAFLIVTPTELYTSIPSQWIGQDGLFTAIIFGFVIPPIVKFIMDKKIYIHMPAGVPPIVEDAFKAVVPSVIIVVIAACINSLMALTSFGNIHQMIYTFIQTPFKSLGLSFVGYTILQFFTSLFMFCGIHGSVVINLIQPAQLAADAENLAALAAHTDLPNIITSSFNLYIQPGGIGCALPIVLSLLIFSKSKRYKSFGKVALVPALFGVSEPVLFGLPCLLNPIMFIPWMLCPVVNTIIAYGATALGLVARLNGVNINWTVPPVLNTFLAGGFGPALISIIIIVVDMIIYFPFIKTLDAHAAKESTEE